MNKRNPDQFFSQLLQSDRVGKPDKAIEDRLMYSFLLKSGGAKLRQNSFYHFFGWLLSFQSLGLKTGLVSVVFFLSVMNNQLSLTTGSTDGSENVSQQRVLVADTTDFIQNLDSIRTDSLN